MNVSLTEGGRMVFRFLIFIGLLSGLAVGCSLLTPSETSGPRVDQAVSVPTGGGTAVIVAGSGAERDSTVADDVVDTVATVGGTITGNPLLWGLAAQLGHLLVGAVAGRRKTAPPPP